MAFLNEYTRQSGLSAGVAPFPDPFCDYASLAFPDTLSDAHKWCEYIMLANGIYRAAVERVISYFITDIEIEGEVGRAEKQKYMDFAHDTLGIQPALRLAALDYLTYGNSMTSLLMPFRRHLSCPGCGFEAPLKRIAQAAKFNYSWRESSFNATCPFCHYSGKWTHIDRRSDDEGEIKLKRWNIHEMELLWDPYTEDVSHIWMIPEYYKRHINKGQLYHMERAPWEVIQAIKHGNHLMFENDYVYHMKESTLCGVLNKGWGISRVLTNFRQAWYVQVLHRTNEAIGLDYVFPLRVLTPEPRPGGTGGGGEQTDPLFTQDMGGFVGHVMSMLAKRRRDPASWFALPFPLRYQMLGAEANNMVPFQLMDQALDGLLNSIGVPVEFYKATLSIQSGPPALRLMESNWSHLTHALNRMLNWLFKRIAARLSWDEVTVKLSKPSHADDLNRQLAKLQLMMGRQISQTTGLKSVGLVFEEEQDRMLEEEEYIAEKSQEAQERLEMSGLGDQMAQPQDPAAAGGGMAMPGAEGIPGGGAPPAGGGAPGGDPAAGGAPVDPVQAIMAQLPQSDMETISLQDLHGMAETIATQIYQLPAPLKSSALRQLNQRNEAVHALVKSKLDSMDQQAGQQGQALAQQAAQQQAAGQISMPPPTGPQQV